MSQFDESLFNPLKNKKVAKCRKTFLAILYIWSSRVFGVGMVVRLICVNSNPYLLYSQNVVFCKTCARIGPHAYRDIALIITLNLNLMT